MALAANTQTEAEGLANEYRRLIHKRTGIKPDEMVVKRTSRRQRKCVTCKSRTAVSRNNCARCLSQIWDEINAGKLTEQQAVERGLFAAAGKPGRPRKRRMASASRKRKAGAA